MRACTKPKTVSLLLLALLAASHAQGVHAADSPGEPCPRPQPGSAVLEPEDLRSQHGTLKVDLSVRNHTEADGSRRYCYVTPSGAQAPTLRLHPGDELILRLRNELSDSQSAPAPEATAANPCSSGAMNATATNLHFHGLTVPAVCHQDDVLKTSIAPGSAPFEYRFRIPANEPPGLYWYHPHIHGFSKQQVLGGASGALIIEGIERAVPEVAGLPERVIVIRDQDLINPDASPSRSEPVVPKMLIDRDGDSANNGTGFGRPAKDLSINYVPVPFPDYPVASITMRPGQRQLWRVLNACAITYLNLAVVFGRTPQQLQVVAIDGVPVNHRGGNTPSVVSVDHIGVPPGSRVEFIVTGPPLGTPALFVTRTVDTGQGGENDPNRALASITAVPDAPTLRSILPQHPTPAAKATLPWLADVTPTRVRRLYFSEKLENPNDPNSATTFYLTVDGETPAPFDMSRQQPNIVVRQGDVEDWIIENRSNELHDFHIHQLHFLLLEWSGIAVNEPYLRDTINVPFFTSRMMSYPSVRIRLDFRDPNTVGTFVYHCHLLEHEDGGMMGTIRVDPRS
jgi:FtsP/CotA-like multicopper oxidase with cupredoxin domain